MTMQIETSHVGSLPRSKKVVDFINNEVNINLFLNSECKNAMNLTDFLSKVQMTLADLAYTKDNGMIKGITNYHLRKIHLIIYRLVILVCLLFHKC